MNQSSLQQVLLLIASGGIGYWPLYLFVEGASQRVGIFGGWWGALGTVGRRILVLVLSVLLALIAWLVLVFLGYAVSPLSGRAWIEQAFDVIWKVGGAAFAASQLRHARTQAAKYDPSS